MYNHFTCILLVSIDKKFAGNYDYVHCKLEISQAYFTLEIFRLF